MYERKQSNCYNEMNKFLEVTRYEKTIVKLEEFVDDLYAFSGFDFKKLIQTSEEFSSLAIDFLKFKFHLVIIVIINLHK